MLNPWAQPPLRRHALPALCCLAGRERSGSRQEDGEEDTERPDLGGKELERLRAKDFGGGGVGSAGKAWRERARSAPSSAMFGAGLLTIKERQRERRVEEDSRTEVDEFHLTMRQMSAS